jgi:EmrB/QacA subfamily drug resistance transporter
MAASAPESRSLIPARIETSPWVILLVLTLGFFMILLDTTIVTIAVPHIEKGLNASFDEILWVLNAYTLVYAVLLLTAGRLGDMFGPRRLFIIGLVVFTGASAACGFSQTSGQLILFRVIQAVGGALLTPQTLGMLPRIFPPEKRGAAFGIWGAVSGLAAVLGPVVGGLLVTAVGWQSIFFINVPVGVLAIVAAALLMPEVAGGKRESLDVPGTILASAGLFLIIFGLIEGQRYAWGAIVDFARFSIGDTRWALIGVYSVIVYGVIILVAFVLYEARAPQPLLPLRIFEDRNFSVSNLVGVALAFCMAGLFIPLSIFLESIRGFTAVHAGLSLLPMSLTLLVAAPVAGRLADRINGKYIVIFGLLVGTVGTLLLINSLSLSESTWNLTFPLAVIGFGMGCTFAPLTALSMRDIEPRIAGVASGVFTTTRQVGMAIGSAVVGAILANAASGNLPTQAARVAGRLPLHYRAGFLHVVDAASRASQSYGAGQHLPAGSLAHNIPAAVLHQIFALVAFVFNQSFLDALRPALLSCAAALALSALTATLLRGGRTAEAARRVHEVQPEAQPAGRELTPVYERN